MSDHSGKLVRNTILYFPAQFFPPLVQFATMVAWTYILEPAGFGTVTFMVAAQEFTAMLSVTWWSLFVLRFRARFAELEDTRFRLMDNLVVACAITAQVALTMPMLWLGGASFDVAIFVSAAAFLISRTVLNHYCEWARSSHLIGLFTTSQLIGNVVGSGLSIAALLLLGPLPAVALAAQAVGNTLALVVLFNRAKLRFRLGRFDPAIFRDAMRYGAPLIVSGVLGWVAVNCIRLLVQYSEGAVGLGLLSVGWGLGQRIAGVLSMLFVGASYPLAVSNLERGDRPGALAQVSLNGVFLLTVLAPTTAGVALLSAPLVNLMIAMQFREATILILPIAILAAVVRALRIHTSDQTMILLERTRVTMHMNILEAGANVVFCAVGLHFGGIAGAALGVLAGTTLASVVSFAYAFLRLELPVPSALTFMRILLATAVMSECVRLMPTAATVSSLVVTIAAGAVVYAGMIILTFPECRTMIGTYAMKYRSAKY